MKAVDNEKKLLDINSKGFQNILYLTMRKALADHLSQQNLNTTADGDEYLSLQQTASLLKIKESTLKKMNVMRVLEYSRPNKYPLYRKSIVLKYIESKHVKSRDEILSEQTKTKNK